MKNQKGITLIALIITILVMLILAAVTISLVISEDGVLSKAQSAVIKMSKAEIKERAELVALDLKMDIETNNFDKVMMVKQEFITRLLKEFNVTKNEVLSNKVVVGDGKYDIIIKDSDLNIEVKENSEFVSLIELSATPKKVSESEDYGYLVELKIVPTMTSTEYQTFRENYEIEQPNNLTIQEKERIVLEYLSNSFEQSFTSMEQFKIYQLNNANFGVTHDNINDWLVETKLLSALNVTSLTEEQLNAILSGTEAESLTNEELIEIGYEDLTSTDYTEEYRDSLSEIELYLEDESLKKYYYVASEEIYTGGIGKNKTYEYEVKDADSNVIAFEKIIVNNIKTENNPYFTTEDNGVWEAIVTEGIGIIQKYNGTETEIIIPIYVGDKKIDMVAGSTFENNDNITKVIMQDNIKEIGGECFKNCDNLKEIQLPDKLHGLGGRLFQNCKSLEKITIPDLVLTIQPDTFNGCTALNEVVMNERVSSILGSAFEGCISLTNITIPNSVTQIYYDAFEGCENITITFEKGSNPIPSGQPWGAENATIIDENL